MRLLYAAFALILALATPALFAEAPPAPDVDTLVSAWFDAPDDASRAAALKALKACQAATIDAVEDAVRRGVWYKPQDPGESTQTIINEFTKQETDCAFWVPPDYDPKKSWPVLLVMHGTGGNGPDFLKRWLPYVRKRGMIVIAPTQLSGVDKINGKPLGKGAGYGATEMERSTVISALHAARRIYNIDSDRVTLTGVSMGGHATWDSMIQRTDCFAGGIVEAGVPLVEGFQLARTVSLANLIQPRLWVMQGTPDKDQPAMNTEATDLLKKLGGTVTYHQIEGRGHGSYSDESDAALDWVMPSTRDLYCRQVTKITHHAIHGRAYWLRIDKLKDVEWDPRAKIEIHTDAALSREEQMAKAQDYIRKHFGTVEAKIAGDNLIEVKTGYVSEFTLFIHPKLVDMSKPITIRVNGREYKKTAKPDVGFMLDEVRKDMDTKRTFYAAVKMNVY